MRWLIALLLLCLSFTLTARTVPVSFIKGMKVCGNWGQYQKRLFARTAAFVNKRGKEKPTAEQLSRAQYKLAMLYAYGVGINRDFKKAFNVLNEAVKWSGNYAAQDAMARFYRQGRGVSLNIAKSIYWQRLADQNRSDRVLARLDTSTPPVQVLIADYKMLYFACKKKAEAGNTGAQIYLGRLYTYGLGVRKNMKSAMVWFEKASTSDSAPAMVELGRAYLRSKNLFTDVQRLAGQWYVKAAKAGYVPGMYYLGRVYFEGVGTDKDLKKAFKWYLKAAKKGYIKAQIELAKMYLRGLGVKQSSQKAIEWLTKAAKRGSSEAMLQLGILYYEGEYTGQSYEQAREWFEKATTRRNAHALYALGMMYFNGEGVTQNYRRAYQALLQGAHNGSELAKNTLGIMHFQGLGVQQNNIIAFAFFNSGGFAKKASEVQKHMTSVQVTEARRLSLVYMRKFNGWEIKGVDHIGKSPLPEGLKDLRIQ
ncbi:SEL1-like repeat protein [Piscirickettsia salmonis]|uniref:SEL1-like repeat protein n=1 Tax=Piscirickettsia salmonis TaxID=1238 RepID=UPI003EBFD1D1